MIRTTGFRARAAGVEAWVDIGPARKSLRNQRRSAPSVSASLTVMRNWNNVERGTRRFHHQTVDHSNTDRAEPSFVSKAKANVERPIPNHGPERLQDYL